MNKIFSYTLLVAGLIASLASCDSGTDFIGIETMPNYDNITTNDTVYYVNTRTFVANPDSIVARTNDCYLGSIIDPETQTRTTCDYLAQFHITEGYSFPTLDRMVKKDANGNVLADSVELSIYFGEFVGDSLATMKVTAHELSLDKVLSEIESYPTTINPYDYVTDNDSNASTLTYTIKDLHAAPSSDLYYRRLNIRLPLAFGNRLLQTYYEHPEYYANAYQFIHKVCPGFYLEHSGGIGAILKTYTSTLHLYFSYKNKADSVVTGLKQMAATGEVIQATHADNSALDSLVAKGDRTYMRTPAGLFTEVDIPVERVVDNIHYNDSINNARISFRRRNTVSSSSYSFKAPQSVLLVTKDQMYSFFDKGQLPDNIHSFLGTLDAKSNTYTFNNIAGMIRYMSELRDKGAGVTSLDSPDEREAKWAAWEVLNPDWNKAMLIPVKPESINVSSTTGSSSTVLYAINHLYGISSVCLEGGANYAEGQGPVELSVIYSHYSGQK